MDEFHPSALRRALFLSVLVAASLAAPVLALAAIADGAPARSSSGASAPLAKDASTEALTAESGSCAHAIHDADFRASFAWTTESVGGSGGASTPMEIRIGKSVAQIFEVSGGENALKCVAVCRLKKTPAQDRKVAALAFQNAIDMDCQAPGFTGLASPAALVFPPGGKGVSQSTGPAVLRFGSWAVGYHDAPLAIGTDRLSSALGG